MKSKFNVGDEIFFMNYSTPAKQKIKGVAFVVGSFNNGQLKKEGTAEKPAIIYCTGTYSSIDEDMCFSTKEELQESLFSKLNAEEVQ